MYQNTETKLAIAAPYCNAKQEADMRLTNCPMILPYGCGDVDGGLEVAQAREESFTRRQSPNRFLYKHPAPSFQSL